MELTDFFSELFFLNKITGGIAMKLSARNQLSGTIESIQKGAINSIVSLVVNGGTTKITSTISNASVDDLELSPGKKATAIIKATEVLVGLGDLKLSARNQIDTTISAITEGAVNAQVSLQASSATFTATISLNAVKELDLKVGMEAKAVIKSTSVMIGI